MPATAQEPADFVAHRGSRWSMHIRDGLVDPKHYKAMGEAIWLYLYLHRECAAKTGLVKLYKRRHVADGPLRARGLRHGDARPARAIRPDQPLCMAGAAFWPISRCAVQFTSEPLRCAVQFT
jgi:hypothetical protein